MTTRKSIEFPEGTIDINELKSAVRQWLRHGLTEKFMRTCVRVGGFRQFSGGLKAGLVGGAVIHLNTVIKLGDKELHLHKCLITAINKKRPRTFASVEHVEDLPDGRVLLLMEDLKRYDTLLETIFEKPVTQTELGRICGHAFDALRKIHDQTEKTLPMLRDFPRTRSPFTSRIRSKLKDIFKVDPDLAILLGNSGVINGCPCPPVNALLDLSDSLEKRCSRKLPLRLVHGDAHIGNIMLRRRGPNGFSVRLIDPNPNIGFSHPLYDIGKLLHWTEPVGWVKYGLDTKKKCCRASWGRSGRGWRLNAVVQPASHAAESRRSFVERNIKDFAESYRTDYGDDFDSMLALATASAHVGLAALYQGTDLATERRAVLAYAIAHLARFQ